MPAFKEILAPVDLSEASPKLVPHILTMAAKFDSEIHLLFVARISSHLTGFYIPYPKITEFEKAVLEGAERKLIEFKEEYFKDWPRTKAKVVCGDISDEIFDYIDTAGIDLLIMGTHGRKGLDRSVFGSVAERVIKTSSVPVLVVNPYGNMAA
jgi:nucleotide-binding universal stress UspA family protein